MCGVAGFFDTTGLSHGAALDIVRRQQASLEHRGPDDAGEWVDAGAGIAFAHRRLSILDLSAAGRQPMASASGRYVMAYNGEIYDHLEIRRELESSAYEAGWNGHSDTETLLAGIDHWGLDRTVRRCTGMFAMAVWDRTERTLTLARDRIGEKPLYYGWHGNSFLFGSELKALRCHPDFDAEVDRRVVALYLRHGYVPAPYSVFARTFKLLPGTFLQIRHGARPGDLPQPRSYWSLEDVAGRGLRAPFEGGDADAVSELDARLRASISLQRVADVPLGAFLSGGIDSTTVVALMQDLSDRPVKTFTIGFHEGTHNEAVHAAKIAAHLRTDHTELIVTPREAMDVIPRLSQVYDEPFGDSSAIPTLLVSELARRHVTVSLSGDGGDELFCGYGRYRRTADGWSRINRLPYRIRKLLSTGLHGFSRGLGSSAAAWKADRVARYLAASGPSDFYQVQVSQRHDELELIVGDESAGHERDTVLPGGQFYDAMMYRDMLTYLPDDILVKVDRASMAYSLESRLPLLDHRIVELAWRLPMRMKVRDGRGKWVLREVLRRYVPQSLFDRPKMGFAVPVGAWIRGPLRDWAESLLSEDRLRRDGYFDPSRVREQWARHLGGAAYGGEGVWQLLMFQDWLASLSSPVAERAPRAASGSR
ncbi:MAG: asparagine synthase (glutamine-hydrolyzing) [Pseudomonadota bacterium]